MTRLPLIIATTACALMTAVPADARSFFMPGAVKSMRISASFQTIVPIIGQMSVEQQAKATESARKSLYQIASRECEVITQVFKGQCAISNLNVRSYVQNRGNGLQQIQVSANATYILRPQNDQDDSNGSDRGGKKL